MTDQVSSADSPFKPDVVIRKGSVSIEISNTATEEEKTEDGMMFDTIHHIAIIRYILHGGAYTMQRFDKLKVG